MKEIVVKNIFKDVNGRDVYDFNSYEDRENEEGGMTSIKIHTEQVTVAQLEATIANAQARLDKIEGIKEK